MNFERKSNENYLSSKSGDFAQPGISIYRELTVGIYFGEKKLSADGNTASPLCEVS
jgi:3-isopropylmalate dehydrogenase|tara:strand:- start:70 stop:237 length:168 start_codon:yes stop_codon:yes gene_type:complete